MPGARSFPSFGKGQNYHQRSSLRRIIRSVQINFELTSEDFRDAFHNFYLGSTKVRIFLCLAVLAVSVTIYAGCPIQPSFG